MSLTSETCSVCVHAAEEGQSDRFMPLNQLIDELLETLAAGRVDEAAAMYGRCAVDIGYQLINRIAGDEALQKVAANMLYRARDFAKAAMVCEALDEFEKAGQLYERADDTYMSAEMYARAGKTERAAAMYDRSGSHTLAGELYLQVGEKERAAECYARIGKSYLAGSLYHELNKNEKAVEHLQRVEPDNEDYIRAVVSLASILMNSGHIQVAEKKLSSVIAGKKADRKNVEVFYILGDLYARTGRNDDARKLFTEVLDYDIRYKDASERLRKLDSQMGGGGTKPHIEGKVQDGEDQAKGDEVVSMDGSLSYLEGLPLFESLSLDDLRAFAGIAHHKEWKKGDVIIEAGDISVGLVIVTDGRIDVVQPGPDGKILATLKKGAHVGEMSLIDDAPTSARVVAAEHSKTIVLPAESVRTLLDSRQVLALRFFQLMSRTLAQRLRDTIARL